MLVTTALVCAFLLGAPFLPSHARARGAGLVVEALRGIRERVLDELAHPAKAVSVGPCRTHPC